MRKPSAIPELDRCRGGGAGDAVPDHARCPPADPHADGAAGGGAPPRRPHHTGETVVLFERRKRRREIAKLLEALVAKHPAGTVYVAWDNADTHQDEEVEDVVRAAVGRLVLLYLPTYSPWLNPIEMLWRDVRREVTHCELFESVKALLADAANFFARHNRESEKTLGLIGSKAAKAN